MLFIQIYMVLLIIYSLCLLLPVVGSLLARLYWSQVASNSCTSYSIDYFNTTSPEQMNNILQAAFSNEFFL